MFKFFLFVTLAATAPRAFGQDELPAVKAGHVQITFLPPPMDGTLSLGLYNKAGRLVRTLHAEAPVDKDFIIGLNGLSTHWDGKDDAGNPVAAGRYSARGYCVGALDVEGVAYRCNDWLMSDEALRVRQITGIHMAENDSLLVSAKLVDGRTLMVLVEKDGSMRVSPETTDAEGDQDGPSGGPKQAVIHGPFAIRDGKLLSAGQDDVGKNENDLTNPINWATGPNGTLWIIDRAPAEISVKQFSASGEFLRKLAIPAADPEPRKIAASVKSEFVALLESNERVQRVRALELEHATPSTEERSALSTWKTAYSKSIQNSDTFNSIAATLDNGKPFGAEERIRVHLLPNPLFKDAVHDLDVRVVTDARGSILATLDGLLLSRIAETRQLKWAVIGREAGSKAFRIFESDGSVVEEFRVHKLANMMAFDAGEYEWK